MQTHRVVTRPTNSKRLKQVYLEVTHLPKHRSRRTIPWSTRYNVTSNAVNNDTIWNVFTTVCYYAPIVTSLSGGRANSTPTRARLSLEETHLVKKSYDSCERSVQLLLAGCHPHAIGACLDQCFFVFVGKPKVFLTIEHLRTCVPGMYVYTFVFLSSNVRST